MYFLGYIDYRLKIDAFFLKLKYISHCLIKSKRHLDPQENNQWENVSNDELNICKYIDRISGNDVLGMNRER